MLPCCLCSGQSFDDWQQNRRIERMLKKEKNRLEAEIKILLLGTGESGKSTIMKQMKLIHSGQESLFENQSIDQIRHIIYQNMLKGMKVLICARDAFLIPWGDSNNIKIADFVSKADTRNIITIEYFSRYSSLLSTLWQDSAIQATFQRRNEFQLSDGFHYLFSNLKRISLEKYLPTASDMLHSRMPTKSVNEFAVRIKGIPFLFVDVGGQRKQRVKWLHCLDNVTSVLFIVSSIEYDQQLVEDMNCNRLCESLATFEAVVNSCFFQRVSFILFINKIDLLTVKLKNLADQIKKQFKTRRPNEFDGNAIRTIKNYFPTFKDDPTNLKDVQEYLLYLFKARCHANKHLYSHFTVAVDTENIKHVFNDVRNTILEQNIAQVMLH